MDCKKSVNSYVFFYVTIFSAVRSIYSFKFNRLFTQLCKSITILQIFKKQIVVKKCKLVQFAMS